MRLPVGDGHWKFGIEPLYPTVFEIRGPRNVNEPVNEPTNTTDRNTPGGDNNYEKVVLSSST